MTSLKVFDLQALRALELPDLQFLVDEILPAGSITLLAGREKAGKSLIVNDLLCSIAMEEPFLGREVQPGPVLLLPAEEHIREIRSRIEKRVGNRNAPISVAPINGQYGQRLQLSDAGSVTQFFETVKELKPVALAIDPLREVHNGAENDSDDMAPLLRPIRGIAHETNTAILLLHHMSKGGNARGSTAIAAAVDQIITFTRVNEEDNQVVKGRLEVNGRFGPRLSIGIELGEGLRWKVSNLTTTEPNNARDRILYLLEGTTAGLTARQIAESLSGLELKSVQNALTAMLRESSPMVTVAGTGAKNDPRLYSSVTPSLFACEENDSSQRQNPRESSGGNHFESFPNGSGNNGNQIGSHLEEGVCADCGQPVESGLHFRCRACIEKAKVRAA